MDGSLSKINVRGLTSALAELSLGLLAVMVALVLLKRLVEHGSLPLAGWLAMTVCGAAVVYFGWRTVGWVDPGARGYLEAIRGSRLDSDPREFISMASGLARGFEDELRSQNFRIDGTVTTLDLLTDFLAANQEMVRENPSLLEGATAYYGEIVRNALKGEWSIGRSAGLGGRRDVVVQVGRGRHKHDISPGLHVYHVASGTGLALQEVLQHELAESDGE